MRQLVCPACGATDRAPGDRNALAAKRGRCGERLFHGVPIEVSGAVIAPSAGLMSTAKIVAWTHQALAQATASALKGG